MITESKIKIDEFLRAGLTIADHASNTWKTLWLSQHTQHLLRFSSRALKLRGRATVCLAKGYLQIGDQATQTLQTLWLSPYIQRLLRPSMRSLKIRAAPMSFRLLGRGHHIACHALPPLGDEARQGSRLLDRLTLPRGQTVAKCKVSLGRRDSVVAGCFPQIN